MAENIFMYLPNLSATSWGTVPFPVTPNEFVVAGYFNAGDGGGGTFVWVAVPVPVTFFDYGITFPHPSDSPLGASGYFKRIYSGPINVLWFGANTVLVNCSTQIQNAINAAAGSTAFFPKGAYLASFSTTNTSIMGDGEGTYIMAPIATTQLPVLTILGGTTKKISNIQFGGGNSVNAWDGVVFDPLDPFAGKCIFENVIFRFCQRGVYKPTGNIDNTFFNCRFLGNDIGYYAHSHIGPTPVDNMHAGCDKFIEGYFAGNISAAAYIYNEIDGFGQVVFDGTIIENNRGLGIMALNKIASGSLSSGRMNVNAVSLRNVWMESNGGEFLGNPKQWVPTTLVTIDAIDYEYDPSVGKYQIVDYYFDGMRSVSFHDSYVVKMYLLQTSVNLFNCRSDNASGLDVNGYPIYNIKLDTDSSITAYELRYSFSPNENIFVNSISYDGTGDIAFNEITPTSVWGPLRSMLVKKVYQTLPYNVKYGSLLDSTSPIAFGTVSSTPVTGGVLGTRCAKLFIPASITASLDLGFSLVAEKYYLWSIHALKDSPNISGNIGIPGDAQLGQVILKQAQWACSYGIKKFSFTTPPTGTVHLSIHNSAGTQGIIYLADVQVVEFDNLSDAISYAQSRAFITTRSEKILGPVHTSSSASAYFRWIASEASFEIENAFNIAEIARIDVGVYNVLFEIALDELPVVQLTPETLEGGGEVDTAVVASFEELSVAGFTVRLVEIIDGVPTPVDNSFSLLVV